jgi:hypothetical protein
MGGGVENIILLLGRQSLVPLPACVQSQLTEESQIAVYVTFYEAMFETKEMR